MAVEAVKLSPWYGSMDDGGDGWPGAHTRKRVTA
jgi:hypothetical protein